MPEPSAWKQDSRGWYLEMLLGSRKDYSIDATDLSGGQDIANVGYSVPAGVQVVGAPELNAKTVKLWLYAAGPAGVYDCQLTITGNGNPAYNEIFPFRVVVR